MNHISPSYISSKNAGSLAMSSKQATPTMTKEMSSIDASSATTDMSLGMFSKSSSRVHTAPSSAHIFSQIGFCRTYCVSTATSSRAHVTQVIGTPAATSRPSRASATQVIGTPAATSRPSRASATQVIGTPASISIDHPSATYAMQITAASSVQGTSGKSESAMQASPSSIAASHSASMAASTLQAVASAPGPFMAASASSNASAIAQETSKLHSMAMSAAQSVYCSIYCSPPAMTASTAAPVATTPAPTTAPNITATSTTVTNTTSNATTATTPAPTTKNPALNYHRTVTFTFSGNCSDFFNSSTKAAFDLHLQQSIASRIGINTTSMDGFNVSCGSIVVSFTLKPDASSPSATTVNDTVTTLTNWIRSGNFLITLADGRNLTADANSLLITVIIPSTAAPSTHPPTTGTTETPKQTTPTEAPGLSGGAIAGIVIGCFIVIALLAVVIYLFLARKKTRKPLTFELGHKSTLKMGDENNIGNDNVGYGTSSR